MEKITTAKLKEIKRLERRHRIAPDPYVCDMILCPYFKTIFVSWFEDGFSFCTRRNCLLNEHIVDIAIIRSFFQAKYRLEESVVRWWSRLPIRPWWIRECREKLGPGKNDYAATFEIIKKRSWSRYDESLSRTFWRKKSAEKFREMMNK
ncbi:MAG: hypothetical protein WDA18_09680 [Candidatus Ratteibacteria bacterium]